jgi:hypothetical protein
LNDVETSEAEKNKELKQEHAKKSGFQSHRLTSQTVCGKA